MDILMDLNFSMDDIILYLCATWIILWYIPYVCSNGKEKKNEQSKEKKNEQSNDKKR